MEIRYQWERNENYLLLEAPTEDGSLYQVKMLEHNDVAGLLKLQLRRINDRAEYRYTVSGFRSLEKTLENRNISLKEIRELISSLNYTASQLEEYLLDADCILLDPALIFCREGDGEAWFCYYPDTRPEQGFHSRFRQLLQYLLNKADHTDDEAVHAVYGMYRISMQDHFRMQDVIRFLLYETDEKQESMMEEIHAESRRAAVPEEEHRKEEAPAEDEERNRRVLWMDRVLALIIAGLALAAVIRLLISLMAVFSYATGLEMALYIGTMVLVIAMSAAAVRKLLGIPTGMQKNLLSDRKAVGAEEEAAENCAAADSAGENNYSREAGKEASGRKTIMDGRQAAGKRFKGHERKKNSSSNGGTEGGLWEEIPLPAAVREQTDYDTCFRVSEGRKSGFSEDGNMGFSGDRKSGFPENRNADYVGDRKHGFPEDRNSDYPEDRDAGSAGNRFSQSSAIGQQESMTTLLQQPAAFMEPSFSCMFHYQGADGLPDFSVDSEHPSLRIGKEAAGADVVLNHPTISRNHATVMLEQGCCVLKDNLSRNGTFVDGLRLEKEEYRILSSGCTVEFADQLYLFLVESDETQVLC